MFLSFKRIAIVAMVLLAVLSLADASKSPPGAHSDASKAVKSNEQFIATTEWQDVHEDTILPQGSIHQL
jgi:hypothetical protein